MATLGGGYTTRASGKRISSRYSLHTSPRQIPEALLSSRSREPLQLRAFPAFTLKKSYWSKVKPLHRVKSPARSIYASMPAIFIKTAPSGRPKPPPLPKDLIVMHSKPGTDYNCLSKVRKHRRESSEELWKPITRLRAEPVQADEWRIEACRNMYLTFDPAAHSYGLRYKSEVKDGFQNKVLKYLEAHRASQLSPELRDLPKKQSKGRLRLHPTKPTELDHFPAVPVTPVIKAMPIE